jgi:hypothetical protein
VLPRRSARPVICPLSFWKVVAPWHVVARPTSCPFFIVEGPRLRRLGERAAGGGDQRGGDDDDDGAHTQIGHRGAGPLSKAECARQQRRRDAPEHAS